MPNSHQSQIPVCGLRHCLTCGSSGHVPVAHLSSSTTSSILVVWTIFWPKFRHALLVGDSVNRWPSSVRHLRHCSFFAVQSPWWKPSGTGHIRCLSSESKENAVIKWNSQDWTFSSLQTFIQTELMLLCNQWKLQDASDFVSYGNGRHTVGTIGFNLGSRKRAATLKGEGISSRLGNRPSEKTGRVWLCVCLCARVCGCRNKH